MTMAASATLLIRQLAGAPLSLRLQPTSTVAQLKAAVAAKASVAVDSQRVRASPHFFVISSRLRVPAVRAASDAPRAPCADCVFWQRARQPEAPQLLWCHGWRRVHDAPGPTHEGHVSQKPLTPSGSACACALSTASATLVCIGCLCVRLMLQPTVRACTSCLPHLRAFDQSTRTGFSLVPGNLLAPRLCMRWPRALLALSHRYSPALVCVLW